MAEFWNLTGQTTLANSDLTGAEMANADLTDADLSDADLTDGYLVNADLTYADLTGVQEVSRKDPVGLGRLELPPRRARAAWRWIDSRGVQDLPHG